MNNFLKALAIGVIAGILDVVPMILQGINKYACISAFIQWTILGIIIPYVRWNLTSWLKGLFIAELALLPVLVLIFEKEPCTLIPIVIITAVLGSLLGFTSGKYIK
jgi:hypothetical protein